MTKIFKQFIDSKVEADKIIERMSPAEKRKLEKAWDTEHAYYSSALEGSRVDKDRFDFLAKKEM